MLRTRHKKPRKHGQRSQFFLPPPWSSKRRLGELLGIPRPADQASDAGISPSRGSSPGAGLTSLNGEALAENFPNPSKEEWVCFVSFLLRGVGFPIHPFQRGLLVYYGLQLHNLTPGSILHIAGFIALYELFLGCEAHFELWRKLFCLAHCS